MKIGLVHSLLLLETLKAYSGKLKLFIAHFNFHVLNISGLQIIPYLASQFRKDKIWMRRTQPNQRDYRILIGVDNSSSMADNLCKQVGHTSLFPSSLRHFQPIPHYSSFLLHR